MAFNGIFGVLKEVLRDEKKIGGVFLQASEPFAIGAANIGETLSISVNELDLNCFNCKYNINSQDIPISHIWNGRNNLLHCSFSLEKYKDISDRQSFNCVINAVHSNQIQMSMKVSQNLMVRKGFGIMESFRSKF